jgi:hypothetical protein
MDVAIDNADSDLASMHAPGICLDHFAPAATIAEADESSSPRR